MTILGILFLVYLTIFFFSYLYVKKDKFLDKKICSIFVLSASNNMVTRQRLNQAISFNKKLDNAVIIACGKDKVAFMRGYLQRKGVVNFRLQDKSTNTLEDAIFGREMIKKNNKPIAVITSPTHQRRAYNSFKKVFRETKIYNYPANPFFSFDSILLPTGWIGLVINFYKDRKYN